MSFDYLRTMWVLKKKSVTRLFKAGDGFVTAPKISEKTSLK